MAASRAARLHAFEPRVFRGIVEAFRADHCGRVGALPGDGLLHGHAAPDRLFVIKLTPDAAGVAVKMMREVIRHAVTLTKHADQLAVRFDDVVTNNNKELRQLLVNLSEASRHLKETVSTLKDDPSEIVWGKNLPEKEIPDK